MTSDVHPQRDLPTRPRVDRPAEPPAPSRFGGTSRRVAVVAMVAVLALAGAACSSSKKSTAATTTTAAAGSSSTTTTTSGGSTSASANVATTSLGVVVVDDKGFTLYFYKNDSTATSTCVGACATAWPPATASGTPTAGTGVTGTLTATTRPDGSTQLVLGPATAGEGLGGHPLYRYSGDTKPGDVSGQGIGGVWSAAGPDGQPVS